jgi:hypothetical protein
MDGKELGDRVKAIKAELAAIQDSETFYRSAKAHTAIQKTAHQARRAALEAIKVELSALAKRNRQWLKDGSHEYAFVVQVLRLGAELVVESDI